MLIRIHNGVDLRHVSVHEAVVTCVCAKLNGKRRATATLSGVRSVGDCA